jgi:hypothetical protein
MVKNPLFIEIIKKDLFKIKTKKCSVRNTQVGQAVNNSSIRKVGEMVKNIYLLKIVPKKLIKVKNIIFYIIL